MGKRQFRGGTVEAARYQTRGELTLTRRRMLAGLGALAGIAGMIGCDPFVTQGEAAMPDTDAGVFDSGIVDSGISDAGASDAGTSDAGLPDAEIMAGEPALPDGGVK